MSDAYDIIDYIKCLKKGFDKDEFKDKIENLSHIVDSVGLNHDDFHNLFKVWLNLTIPITKWMNIGITLVPRDKVEAKTVEYALRWLLANHQNQTSFSRIAFVLDWLTAAMDNDSIDIAALESGYEIFYMLLLYEVITPNAMKLVYNLTKPANVTRRRVIELMEVAKIRDAKKSKCRQLQVLLGLFKSYRPECVPESIPAFSVCTTFKKINPTLLARFGRRQVDRHVETDEKIWLKWLNSINSKRNRKGEPLIPDLEFINLGSRQYAGKENQKNYLDFTEVVPLLRHALRVRMPRPARLRALLPRPAGRLLLCAGAPHTFPALTHQLEHLLRDVFLSGSPYNYSEKRDLLLRLSQLQSCAQRALPVVTWLLAQYMPFWNENDYFNEILSLSEWISVSNPTYPAYILLPLRYAAVRAVPARRVQILYTLANCYDNLAFASTRKRQIFPGSDNPEYYSQMLNNLSAFILDLCNDLLQIDPDDMLTLHTCTDTAERIARTQLRYALPLPPVAPLVISLPLVSVSATAIDRVVLIMLLYKQIFSRLMKSSNASRKMEDQVWTLKAYTSDIISCLWSESALSARSSGLVFSKLAPHVVEKINKFVPNADGALGLGSHIALAAYTHVEIEDIDNTVGENKLWFDTVIETEFQNLSRFLKKAAPELRG